MNSKTFKTQLHILLLLLLISCSKNIINSKSSSKDVEKSKGANIEEFVVLLSGDTIRFDKIKFKYDLIDLETISSKNRRILLNEIDCIQTKDFFVLYNVKNTAIGRPLYRMIVGKINVYYTRPPIYNSPSYYGSNGNFNYGKSSIGFSDYFFEKDKGVFESIFAMQRIEIVIADYPPALALYKKYYPEIKKTMKVSDAKLLEVIKKYNEGFIDKI